MNHKVLVCGTSAWLTGIAEKLNTATHINAQCISPRLLKTTERVATLAPDVMIVERGTWDWTLLRLAPDFLVIEVDAAQNRLLVRNTQEIPVSNVAELIQVISVLTNKGIPENKSSPESMREAGINCDKPVS
jgi:hypothetical protein